MLLSHDGYIRLSLADLASISFEHLVSGPDEDLRAELLSRDVPASAAGYTEWVSETEPRISIGWDWYRDALDRRFVLASSDVRSNLMLVDPRGYDLGMQLTASSIAAFVETLNWKRYLVGDH